MNKIIEHIKENELALIKENESMQNHTSIKTGGNVRLLCIPNDLESLIKLIDVFKEYKVPFYIIGRGSNILVSDDNLEIAIIKISNTLDDIEISNEGKVIVGSGYSLQKLAKQVSKLGLSGLEFAGGIPATIGGAVYMNAGAHSGEMKDIVETITTLNNKGEIKVYNKDDCKFEYRKSIFQINKEIILSATLKLNKGDRAEIFKQMMGNLEYRKEMQPLDRPTFGSVFQNPQGFHSAVLIEQSELKGKKIGGVHVSTKHANFIINHENATTQDVINLIETVKEIVKDNTGINLHNEVIVIDKEDAYVW